MERCSVVGQGEPAPAYEQGVAAAWMPADREDGRRERVTNRPCRSTITLEEESGRTADEGVRPVGFPRDSPEVVTGGDACCYSSELGPIVLEQNSRVSYDERVGSVWFPGYLPQRGRDWLGDECQSSILVESEDLALGRNDEGV